MPNVPDAQFLSSGLRVNLQLVCQLRIVLRGAILLSSPETLIKELGSWCSEFTKLASVCALHWPFSAASVRHLLRRSASRFPASRQFGPLSWIQLPRFNNEILRGPKPRLRPTIRGGTASRCT